MTNPMRSADHRCHSHNDDIRPVHHFRSNEVKRHAALQVRGLQLRCIGSWAGVQRRSKAPVISPIKLGATSARMRRSAVRSRRLR